MKSEEKDGRIFQEQNFGQIFFFFLLLGKDASFKSTKLLSTLHDVLYLFGFSFFGAS